MKTRDLTLIAVFAAVITVCAWISIPAAVPFTLQTLGIFLAVGLLGGRRGTISVGVYLLLGAVGAPVFSGFNGGIGYLLGATGGYLLGFLAMAAVMWGLTAALGDGPPAMALAMVLGLLACYALGTAWFMAVYTRTRGAVSLLSVLSSCVFPFVLPDLLKLGLALLLIRRLKGLVPAA